MYNGQYICHGQVTEMTIHRNEEAFSFQFWDQTSSVNNSFDWLIYIHNITGNATSKPSIGNDDHFISIEDTIQKSAYMYVLKRNM